MLTTSTKTISGQEVTEVIIDDINELNRRIGTTISDTASGVDREAMDSPVTRNAISTNFNVAMGTVGHIVICEIFSSYGINCTLHFDTDGFYLIANEKKVKIRTSAAYSGPCPNKQINAFKITGEEVGTTQKDYYIQIVFCEEFDLTDTTTDIELFVVGGLHKSSLTQTKAYNKKTLAAGQISGSSSLDDIMRIL